MDLASILAPMLTGQMGGATQQPQQIGQMTPTQQGGLSPYYDPTQLAQLETDQLAYQRRNQLAQTLMQNGGQYIPNSGKFGVIAGLAQMLGGKLAQNSNDEKLSDIVRRQMEAQSQAAQAQAAKERSDLTFKTDEDIRKDDAGNKSKLANAGMSYAAGLGGFDPRTGQVSIDPNIQQTEINTKLTEAQNAARIAAANREGPADPFAKFKLAVQQGILTPAQAQQAMQKELMGGGGGTLPSGYRQNQAGTGLEYIPGGPADPATAMNKVQPVSSENRIKLGLLDQAQTGLDKYVNAGTKGGVPTPWANMGHGNTANTSMDDAIANMLRVESGAAISQGEIDAAKQRYTPGKFNSDAENQNRVDLFKQKLATLRSALTTGTNEATGPAGSGAGVGQPTTGAAHAPGDVITVHGRQYKVIGGDPSNPDLAPL